MKTRKQQVHQAIRDAVRVKLTAYRADYVATESDEGAAFMEAKIRAVIARRDKLPSTGGLSRVCLAGKKFGRLLVVFEGGSTRSGSTYWLCRCVCGARKFIVASSLIKGGTVSCGCYARELSAVKCKKIGQGNRRQEPKAKLPVRAQPLPKPKSPALIEAAVSRNPVRLPEMDDKKREAMLLALGRSMRLVYARWSEVAEACGEEIAAELRAEAMAERGAV